MRKGSLLAVLGLIPALAVGANAQKPLAVEGGIFGQFTKIDQELSLEDVLSIGARLGLYVLPRLSVEVDGHIALVAEDLARGLDTADDSVDLGE